MSIAEKFEVIADEVYEKGKKFFVKNITNNGTRTYYYRAFQNSAFEEGANFYGLCKPVIAGYMFYNQTGEYLPKGIDLSNIEVSKSATQNSANLYAWCSKVLEIPDYNMPALEKYDVTYGYCSALHTIHGKIRVNENTEFSNTFLNCNSLENLSIEGTIGQNGFNVSACTRLTVASLLSILTALSKDQSIASGKSVTFADNHLAVVQADEDCLEQLSSASTAGWSIFFGTTKYEG